MARVLLISAKTDCFGSKTLSNSSSNTMRLFDEFIFSSTYKMSDDNESDRNLNNPSFVLKEIFKMSVYTFSSSHTLFSVPCF